MQAKVHINGRQYKQGIQLYYCIIKTLPYCVLHFALRNKRMSRTSTHPSEANWPVNRTETVLPCLDFTEGTMLIFFFFFF